MKRSSIARTLRRRLLAGLVVIAPVTITAFVVWWIFDRLDGLLGRFLYPALGVAIPGLGLILLVAILTGVGWAAEKAVGARVILAWNTLLERMPVTRRIYGTANRIVRTFLGEDRGFFGRVVLVEYPSPGRWSVGFLTSHSPAAVQEHVPDSVTVFVPTTPNPTSGWLVVVAQDKVVPVDMSMEEAVTFVLSAGGVTPESGAVPTEAQLQQMTVS